MLMLLSNKDYGGTPTTITLHALPNKFLTFSSSSLYSSLYYHYQTVIICLNQIDTPPVAFLAELQKS